MRRTAITLALLASSGCALVSGLASLDVDERDASNVQTGDSGAEAEAGVPPPIDAGPKDAASELGTNDLICGPSLTCALPSQSCCFGDSGVCIAGDGGTCSGQVVACDYTAQCATGQVCCATLESGKPKGSLCKASGYCNAPSGYRLCRFDNECTGGGKCITVPTFNGYSYCQ